MKSEAWQQKSTDKMIILLESCNKKTQITCSMKRLEYRLLYMISWNMAIKDIITGFRLTKILDGMIQFEIKQSNQIALVYYNRW